MGGGVNGVVTGVMHLILCVDDVNGSCEGLITSSTVHLCKHMNVDR